MTRVWMAQCLCPARHCILANASEVEDASEAEAVTRVLRGAIADLLKTGDINPWCGLCHAGVETWTYELSRTRFRSLAEAKPEFERLQDEQIAVGIARGEILGPR